ncbi:MAG: Glutamate-1-semialdehyde 2,1-aminomutase [Syntrophorhabdaceae bacterium]|nr:Glutamate-1-semialdehyde 2,1-aminomutase [Syntrophorhabdaceae bacterium]HQP51570.1 glutamate-1-semialdehyde 2,1-aminomutase [Syntrophorhabdaceae bacterium]
MNKEKSKIFFDKAKKMMPGGVNSPVRAFISVNDNPFFVKRAKGAYIYDVDGNSYLDYVASWGAIILGHADSGLIKEVIDALENGTSFGACHPNEIELAKLITDAFPSIELLRLTSSGTEATMSAIRLARGYTGKNGVIKFRGCYHGHVDSLLVKAGSGLATFGVPDSKGVPYDLAKHTHIAEFNHIDSVMRIVEKNKDIACVIVEPIMGNVGVVLPESNFLEDLEVLCRNAGIMIIFDEVITGFRVAFGGAQHIYNIDPDITCMGKIIGGGFPIGLYGGKQKIMECVSPLGDVYQAGTLSGNPVAVRAGIYVINYLKNNLHIYDNIADYGIKLKKAVCDIARDCGIPYVVNNITGMFTGFFSDNPVNDYDSAMSSNRKLYEKFFKIMIEEGLSFAPSPFEASFITLSHGNDELLKTIDAYERMFKRLQ